LMQVPQKVCLLLRMCSNAGRCISLSLIFSLSEVWRRLSQYAVGDCPGTVRLGGSSISASIAHQESASAVSGQAVDLSTIDALFAASDVSYLKCDVEGHEEALLRGAGELIERCRPRIAATCYHVENDPEEMVRIVRRRVPTYRCARSGYSDKNGKPVMLHFCDSNGSCV
jgi:hypothetical protein